MTESPAVLAGEEPTGVTEPAAKVNEEQLVAQKVLEQLGTPTNLSRVSARRLWNNRFRVNVYCIKDANRPVTAIAMTDSFFVTLEEEGEIAANPAITRKYGNN